MKLNRKLVIEYNWSNDGDDIPEHVEALEECATSRIAEMMVQGYTSGGLHDNIRILDSDGDNGIDYYGWWELTGSVEGEL